MGSTCAKNRLNVLLFVSLFLNSGCSVYWGGVLTSTVYSLALRTGYLGQSGSVDTAGIPSTVDERDGTHLLFADNTPGKNGNLVLLREGDYGQGLNFYVSTDQGANWTKYLVTPGSAACMNVHGAVQDSINHKFHISWVDAAAYDQYGRFTPTYTGGDITGFTVDTNYVHFDPLLTPDTPGPRDLIEIVDISGNHRLAFAATEASTSATGLYHVAVTTVAGGVSPSSISDWCKMTDNTATAAEDILLADAYATSDTTSTFMIGLSSNLASGGTGSFAVVAGFPTDKKLLSWTITPTVSNNFTIGATQTRSANFSDGTLAAASFSVFSAPSGAGLVVYSEGSTSSAPGLHVAALSSSGTWTTDYYPQPSTSTAAQHAIIETDSGSNPSVLYADGSSHLKATYFWNNAWSSPVQISTITTPSAAWNISNVWTSSSQDKFGIYVDAGAGNPTGFASAYWK